MNKNTREDIVTALSRDLHTMTVERDFYKAQVATLEKALGKFAVLDSELLPTRPSKR